MGRNWDDQPEMDIQRRPASPHTGSAYGPTSPNTQGDQVVEGRVTHVSEDAPYPAPGYPQGYPQGYPANQQAYPPAPYTGYAPAPNAGWGQPPQEPREPSSLAQPFPRWLTIATPLVMIFTLAIAFFAETLLLRSDWATGALAASLAAFALALVVAIVLIIRIIRGRRALSTVALAALLALALVGSGVAGISQLNPLRAAQGRQLEAAGQYGLAIQEYARSGESAPNAPDIARAYTEWGETLAKGGDYADAVAKLTTVTQTYGHSGAVVGRASKDLYNAYTAWIAANTNGVPYQAALTFLTSYANDAACDATCKTGVANTSAQAHFQYGQQLATARQYQQAITEFELVQSQYSKSAYAPKAHAAAALSYMTLATATLKANCAGAVPLFQTLSNNYGDTSQGQQAASQLGAPVAVTGDIAGAPSSPAVTIYFSLHVNPSNSYASGEYHTTLNSSTGAYSFSSVKPGVYYPTTLQTTSTEITYSYWPGVNGAAAYSVTVGPLCAFQVPELKW